MTTRQLPVEVFFITLERVHDEAAALEAWRQYVRAHGWSKVREPKISGLHVFGLVVKTDDPVEIKPDWRGIALAVP